MKRKIYEVILPQEVQGYIMFTFGRNEEKRLRLVEYIDTSDLGLVFIDDYGLSNQDYNDVYFIEYDDGGQVSYLYQSIDNDESSLQKFINNQLEKYETLLENTNFVIAHRTHPTKPNTRQTKNIFRPLIIAPVVLDKESSYLASRYNSIGVLTNNLYYYRDYLFNINDSPKDLQEYIRYTLENVKWNKQPDVLTIAHRKHPTRTNIRQVAWFKCRTDKQVHWLD